jgi:hypothetical protein
VARGRVVPPCRLHRHQPEVANEARRPLLQPQGYSGTVDHGGQECGEVDQASCRRFKDNEARLQLFALAYNLANFLRQLVLPKPIQDWTLTTLREKLVKIGAKVVSHAKYMVFQLAEVAVPRQLFAALVERIGRLRLVCASG